MGAATRLPGEAARLRALTFQDALSSHTHSMASQCWHSTHMHMLPIFNALLVKSSLNLLPMWLPNLSPLRCVLLARVGVLRPCKQHTSAMRCSATGQYAHLVGIPFGGCCGAPLLAVSRPAALLLLALLQLAKGFGADHACACSGNQPLRPCPPGLD